MAVTVKRKISNETQRYGGFSDIEIKPQDAEIEIGDSFMRSEQKRAEASFDYSKPSVRIANEKPEVKQDVAIPQEDYSQYMFNIRSQKQQEEAVEKSVSKERQKIDGRTKLLLGVYISVIVLLSALVIGTGIYLTTNATKVDALQNELTVKNAYLSEQIAQINVLSDEDVISGKAFANGMEKVTTSEVIELLPMQDVKTYEGTTNWFDSFCDWLSGVMGG